MKQERGLFYTPTMASKIINACAALHNICLQRDPEYLTTDTEEDHNPTDPLIDDRDLFNIGHQNREMLLQCFV